MAADVSGDAGALVPAEPEGGESLPAQTEPTHAPPPATTAPLVDHARTHGLQMPHRFRFYTVYGVLALALCAGVAVLVVFANRSISPAPKWSSWQPSGGGLGAARQIADHVSPSYRLPNGNQLVDVIAEAPSLTPNSKKTLPVHFLAIRGANGQVSPDSVFGISSADSVMYSLCGLGTNCSIATGTPSLARGRLVRREILELALYTFRYVGGIQNVIAFMPPQPGAAPQYVVYLRRSDLAAQLSTPLAESLAAKTPLQNSINAHEVRLVDAATVSKIYSFSPAQTQTGELALVLTPTSS